MQAKWGECMRGKLDEEGDGEGGEIWRLDEGDQEDEEENEEEEEEHHDTGSKEVGKDY